MNQCNENMPFIFISYSHKDSEMVLPIISRLGAEGYNVWYDAGIEAGTEWDENVAKHIEKCTYFVVFVSKHYIDSKNCKDELNYSRDLDKEMFLIYLEDVDLPAGMAMRLNRIQAVFWNKYMPDDTEAAYHKIFTASGIEKTKVFMPDMDVPSGMQSVIMPHPQGLAHMHANATAKKTEKNLVLKVALVICAILIVFLLAVIFILGGFLIKKQPDSGETTEVISDASMEYYTDVDSNHPLYSYYEKAKDGDAEAMLYLGDSYWNGSNGVEKDDTEAFYWIEKAADSGNVTAMYRAVCFYYDGDAVSADGYKKCIDWCTAILETEPNNAEVMFMMGNFYYRGNYGVEENPELAFSWWHEAARFGHLDAIYNVAWCYEKGYGVQPDYDKAMEWNQILIDAGYEF